MLLVAGAIYLVCFRFALGNIARGAGAHRFFVTRLSTASFDYVWKK
ncbi:hypothetical protein [Siccibacter turicensis]|nr:hypothetical protein [Siccibacter turicensis]